MSVHMIRTHDEWEDINEWWSTFEVHKTVSFWSSVTVGDCGSRQCGLSNTTLKTSTPNNDDTVKMTVRTHQAEDVDSVEVVAVVVMAVVVVVPVAEEM